jgi:anti-sigma factor ChrR (cupin superfamily)
MDDRVQPIVLKHLFGPGSNYEALPWRPFRPGVSIYRIYGNQHEGPSAALLRYEPGTGVPYHEHAGYEHILVLADSQSDERGENHAGTLLVNPPGSGHTVHSRGGSIVLAIWEKPIWFPNSEDAHPPHTVDDDVAHSR